MGSEEVVQEIRNDTYRTNLGTVGKEIDVFFGTNPFFQEFLALARKPLHSYTHAGLLQLGRRFAGGRLAPNYSEGEIVEAINLATSAIFMVNNIVMKHLGFNQEWERNTTLFFEWGKH